MITISSHAHTTIFVWQSVVGLIKKRREESEDDERNVLEGAEGDDDVEQEECHGLLLLKNAII